MNDVLVQFADDLRLQGRVENTIKQHRQELQRLGRWCDEQGLIWSQLTKLQLQVYIRARSNRMGISGRGNLLCTLRVFFTWAVDQELCSKSPATGNKTPRRHKPLPRSLNLEQVRTLIAFLGQREGLKARRDEAVLLTAIYAGLRARELAELTWSAVDMDEQIINIVISKMNHGRAVPVHEELHRVLANWRELQGRGLGPVFSFDGLPVVPNRIGKIARAASSGSGVKFTAHMLRHTCATWALRRSGNLYAVSKLLGHSQLAQTEVYVSTDVSDVRPAVAALPDLGKW